MPDPCDPVTPATAAQTIQQSMVGAATLCAELTDTITQKIVDAIVSAANICDRCDEVISETVTGPLDEGIRVVERMETLTLSEINALIAQAGRILEGIQAEFEETFGETPSETPIEPPEPPEPVSETTTPIQETNGEAVTGEPEGEPLPEPDPPIIVIAQAGETGLITQCRSDLYTTPELLNQFMTAITSTPLGLPSEASGVGQGIGTMLAKSGLGNIPFVGKQLSSLAQNLDVVATNLIRSFVNLVGCGATTVAIAPIEALALAAAQYIAPNLSELTLPITYARRSSCPTGFPSSAQTIGAFLANSISETIARSWTSINNDCWEPMKAVIQSQRSKLTAGEILALHLRGHIDEGQFTTRLRELGYLKASDYQDIRDLGRWLIPPSDQIRLMVRDAFRKGIVKKFGLDNLFEDAFSSEAQKLAAKQGIATSDMKLLWRAHWDIPAPGQLFNMAHRLPFVSDEFITSANAQLTRMGVDQTITRADLTQEKVIGDVFDAMVQQDILPFWIPRLFSLTFRPFARREINRLADNNVISAERTTDAYRELGMSQANAETLTRAAAVRRDQRAGSTEPVRLFKAGDLSRAQAAARLPELGVSEPRIKQVLDDAARAQSNHDALRAYRRNAIDRKEAIARLERHGITSEVFRPWLADIDAERTTHRAVKKYKSGLLTRAAAAREMETDGIANDTILRLLDDVDDALSASLMKFCATAVEKRFLLGELTEGQVSRELGGLGMAGQLVDWWTRRMACKRGSIGKHIPAGRLIRWLEMGLIGADEFVQRLVRMGFSQGDAIATLREASTTIETKRAKQREQLAKKAIAQIEKEQRERDTRQRRSVAEVRRIQKLQEAARKARERREKRLVEAADKLRVKMGIELAAAIATSRNAIGIGRADFGFDPDERLEVLETAIKRWTPEDDAPFIERYREVSNARSVAEQLA